MDVNQTKKSGALAEEQLHEVKFAFDRESSHVSQKCFGGGRGSKHPLEMERDKVRKTNTRKKPNRSVALLLVAGWKDFNAY